jgi:rhodanese-related sulfurtransferase
VLYSRGSRSHSSRRHRSPPQEVEPIIASAYDIVCDVRSPGEFEEDRVLGSTSTPVLNNEERARVGTLYKQVRIAEGPAGRPHHCPFKLDAQPHSLLTYAYSGPERGHQFQHLYTVSLSSSTTAAPP